MPTFSIPHVPVRGSTRHRAPRVAGLQRGGALGVGVEAHDRLGRPRGWSVRRGRPRRVESGESRCDAAPGRTTSSGAATLRRRPSARMHRSSPRRPPRRRAAGAWRKAGPSPADCLLPGVAAAPLMVSAAPRRRRRLRSTISYSSLRAVATTGLPDFRDHSPGFNRSGRRSRKGAATCVARRARWVPRPSRARRPRRRRRRRSVNRGARGRQATVQFERPAAAPSSSTSSRSVVRQRRCRPATHGRAASSAPTRVFVDENRESGRRRHGQPRRRRCDVLAAMAPCGPTAWRTA